MAQNNLIVGEYGVQFIMGVTFDMSSNTALTFKFLKPDKTTILSVTGTLGTTEITTPAGVFAANTWASYTFVDGDLDQAGDWQAELTYEGGPSVKLKSTIADFEVQRDID